MQPGRKFRILDPQLAGQSSAEPGVRRRIPDDDEADSAPGPLGVLLQKLFAPCAVDIGQIGPQGSHHHSVAKLHLADLARTSKMGEVDQLAFSSLCSYCGVKLWIRFEDLHVEEKGVGQKYMFRPSQYVPFVEISG